MKLVVILPALNEEATIADVISRIPASIAGIDSIEVVVVDDGSTDETARLARQAGAHVVSHLENRGVGAAFATGIDAALGLGADIVVNMDADGQFDPADIPALIHPIVRHGYGFVTCTRFGNPAFVPQMPWVKKWGNRMMCRIVNWVIWNAGFTDVSCGFRAYTRDTVLKLTLFGGFTYTQESFIDLAAKRVRMTEVPLKVRGVREYGKSRVASSLWKYTTQTVPIIARAMRDTRPLKFFGLLALACFLFGLAQIGFVGAWWIATGATSPWKSMITMGAACVILGVLIGIMALISDQLGRVRKLQEELLEISRQDKYERDCHASSLSCRTDSAPQGDNIRLRADSSVATNPTPGT